MRYERERVSDWLVRVDRVVAALVCWPAVASLNSPTNKNSRTHSHPPSSIRNVSRFIVPCFTRLSFAFASLCAARLAPERRSIPINCDRHGPLGCRWNTRDACHFQVAENGTHSMTMDEPQCSRVLQIQAIFTLLPCQFALSFLLLIFPHVPHLRGRLE
jgi:hypothetical protein